MTKVSREHFEMAVTAFTDSGRLIDAVVCERFAEILARESSEYGVILSENIELRQKITELCNISQKQKAFCGATAV